MRLQDRELYDFLYGAPYPRGYPPNLQRVIARKLQMLKAATRLNDLRIPPANRLEALKGDLAGWYSIRVNSQYRLIFRWDDEEKEAYDVYFDDYHD